MLESYGPFVAGVHRSWVVDVRLRSLTEILSEGKRVLQAQADDVDVRRAYYILRRVLWTWCASPVAPPELCTPETLNQVTHSLVTLGLNTPGAVDGFSDLLKGPVGEAQPLLAGVCTFIRAHPHAIVVLSSGVRRPPAGWSQLVAEHIACETGLATQVYTLGECPATLPSNIIVAGRLRPLAPLFAAAGNGTSTVHQAYVEGCIDEDSIGASELSESLVAGFLPPLIGVDVEAQIKKVVTVKGASAIAPQRRMVGNLDVVAHRPPAPGGETREFERAVQALVAWPSGTRKVWTRNADGEVDIMVRTESTWVQRTIATDCLDQGMIVHVLRQVGNVGVNAVLPQHLGALKTNANWKIQVIGATRATAEIETAATAGGVDRNALMKLNPQRVAGWCDCQSTVFPGNALMFHAFAIWAGLTDETARAARNEWNNRTTAAAAAGTDAHRQAISTWLGLHGEHRYPGEWTASHAQRTVDLGLILAIRTCANGGEEEWEDFNDGDDDAWLE